MASENKKRKVYSCLNKTLFSEIVRLLPTKSVQSITTITGISRSRIYELKKYVETTDGECNFESFIRKRGRRKVEKTTIEAKLREIINRDNSLTQVGLREILINEGERISRSGLNRVMKSSGLVKKRKKKKSNAVLKKSNLQVVSDRLCCNDGQKEGQDNCVPR